MFPQVVFIALDEPPSHYGTLLRKAGCSLEDAAARGDLACIDATAAPYPWMSAGQPEAVEGPPRVLHLRADALATLIPVDVTTLGSGNIATRASGAAEAAPQTSAAESPRVRPRFILLKKPGTQSAVTAARRVAIDADAGTAPPESTELAPGPPPPLPTRVFTFRDSRGGALRPLAALVRSCFQAMEHFGSNGASKRVLVIDDLSTLHIAGGMCPLQTLV